MFDPNAGTQRGGVLHGARCFIVLDGRPIAYAQNFSCAWSLNQAPQKVLGSLGTVEHVTVDYNIDSLDMGLVELIDRNLIDLGIQPTYETALTSREFVIEVKDNPTDTAKWVIEGVKFSRANLSIAHGQVTVTGVSLVGLRIRDGKGRA